MQMLTTKTACSGDAVRLPLDVWSSSEQMGDELMLTTGCMLSGNERYCSRQHYVRNKPAGVSLFKESRAL